MANKQNKGRISKALKRKSLSVEKLLEADFNMLDNVLDAVIDMRSQRQIAHIQVVLIDKNGKMRIASDLGRAGSVLLLETAKTTYLTNSMLYPDDTLECDFEDIDLLEDDNENE